MTTADLQPYLIGIASFIAGGIATSAIGFLRDRVRTLTYAVVHYPVGLSANDPNFGVVGVTWQGAELANLWRSTVTLENGSTRDYTNFDVVAYTGPDTRLLSAMTKISGTPNILLHTARFHDAIRAPEGAQPTQQQRDFFAHRREYRVDVMNRGQKFEFIYLTTVLPPATGPVVHLDIVLEGVRLEYQPNVALVQGVPARKAAAIGLGAVVAAVLLASFLVTQPWLAALIGGVAGLFGQVLGAYCYKVYKLAKNLAVR